MIKQDMIEVIKEAIVNNLWDAGGPYNLAETILMAMEDAGMEPPKEVYQNIDRDGKRQVSIHNGDLTNHWETPEEIKWKKKHNKKHGG